MTPPISNNDTGRLVVINEKTSSSIVINDVVLNKEDTIGKEIISVNMRQTLILPQTPIQNKIIPVVTFAGMRRYGPKTFTFLPVTKTNRKQFNFLS